MPICRDETGDSQFRFVCKVTDLDDSRGQEFIINETEIVLFKVDGRISAFHNVCIHNHRAIIHDGFIENGYVLCPAHSWKFSLENGKQPGGKQGLDCYGVEIRGDDVFVKVFRKPCNW